MKIAYIATGAANMYCGSCMRDNTLVVAMQSLGYQVVMTPRYSPPGLSRGQASSDKRPITGDRLPGPYLA
jgi:hypothetical protein